MLLKYSYIPLRKPTSITNRTYKRVWRKQSLKCKKIEKKTKNIGMENPRVLSTSFVELETSRA